MARRARQAPDEAGRRVGLVVGKFAPLHRGHQHLLDTARRETDELVIGIYDTPGYHPRIDVRAGWLRRLYSDAHVLVLDDPGFDRTHDDEDAARLYAEHLRRRYTGPVTDVFSSELYGEPFARHLGARHVLVDSGRTAVPISGTAVRSDPYRHRTFLDPLVYRSLIVKVCFAGAESTGKTTLARACAERYGTAWMPEYGRELFEARGGRLRLEDFLEIAKEHLRREDELAAEAERFLFCDTNALATEFWSRFYCGRVQPELARLAEEVQGDYLYALCGADTPWFQDGWRETGGGALWHEHQATIRADLVRRGLEFVEIRGSLDERVEQVSGWLEKLAVTR